VLEWIVSLDACKLHTEFEVENFRKLSGRKVQNMEEHILNFFWGKWGMLNSMAPKQGCVQ
jgi:hypothetical protein